MRTDAPHGKPQEHRHGPAEKAGAKQNANRERPTPGARTEQARNDGQGPSSRSAAERSANKERHMGAHGAKHDHTTGTMDLTKEAIKLQTSAKGDPANKERHVGTHGAKHERGTSRMDLTKDAIKLQSPARADNSKPAGTPERQDGGTRRMDLTSDAVKMAARHPNREASAGAAGKDAAQSAREQTERTVLHTPRDASGRITGVPFPFDGAKPAEGSVKRYLAAQTARDKQSLLDPNTTLRVEIGASRPGGEQYNQNLTDRRGQELVGELRGAGVKAQIDVISTGESQAKKAEKPERQDDAGDRVANFSIKRGAEQPVERGNVGSAVKSTFDALTKPARDRNAQEVGGMLLDSVKKGIEKTLTTGDPKRGMVEAAKELGKQGERWTREKLIQDLKEKQILPGLAANYTRGVLDGMARQANAGARYQDSRNYYANDNSPFYQAGLAHASELAGKMPAAAWKNIETVMRNPEQRREFERMAAERIQVQLLSRGASHLPARPAKDDQ
jgi:outer membrane protein OmpA-like peptidoglycan-associated protein